MQNIDFYSGTNSSFRQPEFSTHDPEYFSKISKLQEKKIAQTHKKASRLLAIIIGLCIISFTAGLVTGIKFTGGADKEIVDNDTKNAVSNLKTRVSGMMHTTSEGNQVSTDSKPDTVSNSNANTQVNDEVKSATTSTEAKPKAGETFPISEYPFVIRVNKEYTPRQSQDIAKYLSGKGHTVIISKQNDLHKIYIGPYKSQNLAEQAVKKIQNYTDNYWNINISLIKR